MFSKHYIQACKNISKENIIEYQKKWSTYVIEIGQQYLDNDDYKSHANLFFDDLYSDRPDIMFKPTQAYNVPFRNTRDDILSYFVTGKIEEDNGFALKPWSSIKWSNNNFFLKENIAIVMGKYTFNSIHTNTNIEAEYTFGYIKCEDTNKLSIFLHHSSLPYNPNNISCMTRWF
tara:strand:+ start:1051 stop:1572 length:522 start_codon:yes stop_codon:yes gene_type:complete